MGADKISNALHLRFQTAGAFGGSNLPPGQIAGSVVVPEGRFLENWGMSCRISAADGRIGINQSASIGRAGAGGDPHLKKSPETGKKG